MRSGGKTKEHGVFSGMEAFRRTVEAFLKPGIKEL